MSSSNTVLTNNKRFHNTYIHPGPITVSDHIPIQLIISTSPIQKPVKQRIVMSRVNWLICREELIRLQVPDLDNKLIEEVDEAVNTVIEAVQTAIENNIPKTTYRILSHNKANEAMRQTYKHYMYRLRTTPSNTRCNPSTLVQH